MAFPPVKSFIVHRSNWYSRVGTVALTNGTLFSSEYPLTNLIDGKIGPMTRFATTAMGVRITLSGEQNVNLVGVCNHNLDPNLLIQPIVDGVTLSRTFSVAYPHCWIDLRGFNSPTATGLPLTTVELRVAGNSRPIAVSEIVVAGAYLFDGTIETPFNQTIKGPTVRRYSEAGRLLESGRGTTTRGMRLNLQVGTTELGYLQSIWDDVGEHGEFVPLAPSSHINDLWITRWPKRRDFTYLRSGQLIKVPLELAEEAGGVVV